MRPFLTESNRGVGSRLYDNTAPALEMEAIAYRIGDRVT
jgi:hypothetical protein